MKRLWKKIPPCYADVHGFQTVINDTDGLGLVDDCSRCRLLSFGGNHNGHERHGGHGGRGGRNRSGEDGSIGARGDHGREMSRHGNRAAYAGEARSLTEKKQSTAYAPRCCDPSKHLGPESGLRAVHTGIRDPDIIHGTEQKVLDVFAEEQAVYQASFALFTQAPSSAMIGSDLDHAAEQCARSSGIPISSVNIDGSKDYLYGISCTLEAMGKLLLEKKETIPRTVNILGCNRIDWSEFTLTGLENRLKSAGFTVLSRWGMKESTEHLKSAAAAAVNLVVNVSGMRLARYMEQEYSIPYVVGAPFGGYQLHEVMQRLKMPDIQELEESAEEPEVLVIGEQFTAAAIRNALIYQGYQAVRVLSFYEMDRQLFALGDAKLSSEDDLKKQLDLPGIKLVIGDPDYQVLAGDHIRWIGLPNPGSMSPVNRLDRVNLFGEALDQWLTQIN